MRKIVLLLSVILLAVMSAASNVAACDWMNGEPEGDASPNLSYDSANNRFLMVYTKCVGADRPDVYGKILKADGTAYGSEFIISSDVNDQNIPVASYDSVNRKFLVVWFDDRNDPDNTYDIYGQVINPDGTLNGGNFAVCDDDNDQYSPVVAFDSVTGRFLVVWYDDRDDPWSTYDIYAQLVNSDGDLNGGNFVIADDPSNQTDPQIAYDSVNRKFLVAWSDYRGVTIDIYGQFVNTDGTLQDGNFIISDAPGNQLLPSAAYDNSNQRFMVSWHDFRNPCDDPLAPCANSDIYGQVVDADGSLNGTDVSIASNDENPLYGPAAAYDEASRKFMVVWYGTYIQPDELGDGDIHAQSISADGTLEGSDITISNAADNQYGPSIVYNPACENFMIAYWTDTMSNAVITVSPYGECAAPAPTAPELESPPTAPGLVSPANGSTGLDSTVTFTWNPSTDPDGDTVTYQLSYCTNQNFTGCNPVNVASLGKEHTYYAGIGYPSGLFLLGMVFIGGVRNKKNLILLLSACMTASLILVSCGGGSGGSSSSGSSSPSPDSRESFTVQGLNAGTTYYWKVTADDGNGGTSDSETRSFTTK